MISDTPSYYFIQSQMLSFVIAEEDLRIETSYPFNEVINSCVSAQ